MQAVPKEKDYKGSSLSPEKLEKSMVIVLVGTLINIILDPLLIFTFDMGIAGAAWATIIAQLVTTIMVIQHFLSEKSPMRELKRVNYFKVRIGVYSSSSFAEYRKAASSFYYESPHALLKDLNITSTFTWTVKFTKINALPTA